MQQLASSLLGFNVTKTMKAAQSLYEIGLITYLRTDSPRAAPEAIQDLFSYLKTNSMDCVTTPNAFGGNSSSQDAHECIRPTDILKTPDKLFVDTDQKELYKIIWERFVASQMSAAVFDTVNVTINCNNKILKASGKILSKEGWLSVCPYHKGKDDKLLPVMNKSSLLSLIKVDCEQKFTQPPSRYTESTLLKELEEKSIGRPSTYADIIEKIKDRNYVELINKSYHGTKTGEKVIDTLSKYYSFMDYKYTADMEYELDQVEKGIIDYKTFITNFFILFQREFRDAHLNNTIDYKFNCKKCNNKMILKNSKYGYYMQCSNYPRCTQTDSIDYFDGKIVESVNSKIYEKYKCPKCNSNMRYKTNHFGPLLACVRGYECNGILPYSYSSCVVCTAETTISFSEQEAYSLCLNDSCQSKIKLSDEEASKYLPRKFFLKEDNK